jgi:hypothetical protein
LAASERPEAADDEIQWQLEHMNAEVRSALASLPLLGEDHAGPLGPGLLATGALAENIRRIQSNVRG